MPMSPSTRQKREASELPVELRTPEARVLTALVPPDPSVPQIDWPSLTSRQIAQVLGTSELSDLIRRAVRGIPPGSSTKTGAPHPGLIAKGCVVEYTLDVCGVSEIYYRITSKGINVLTEYLKHNQIPPLRDRKSCVNDRYKRTEE